MSNALNALNTALYVRGPAQYQHLPHLVPAGWSWAGENTGWAAPEVVYRLNDETEGGHPVFVGFWPVASGCQIGVFPLGVGSDRLRLQEPLIAEWSRLDTPFVAIGQVPADLIRLHPPGVPADIVTSTLEAAAARLTTANYSEVSSRLVHLAAVKAWDMMHRSTGAIAADAFMDRLPRPDGRDASILMQEIFEALGRSLPSAIPYMQDFPYRIRALILRGGPGSLNVPDS